MLDAKDVQLIGEVVDAKLREQDKRLDQKLERKLGALRTEIRDDIIAVIEDNIQPQISKLSARVTRLERIILT